MSPDDQQVDENPTEARISSALDAQPHAPEFRMCQAPDQVPTLEVGSAELHEVCRRLRDDAGFQVCTLVTAVDHHPRTPRFEMTYMLQSLEHADRVRVHCPVPDLGPAAGSVATITDLWRSAAFSERECYDMFGVRFEGHEGLKRLLMPEEYEHFPLRKDFPHQGIEPDKLYREWDRKRREEPAS